MFNWLKTSESEKILHRWSVLHSKNVDLRNAIRDLRRIDELTKENEELRRELCAQTKSNAMHRTQ